MWKSNKQIEEFFGKYVITLVAPEGIQVLILPRENQTLDFNSIKELLKRLSEAELVTELNTD